LSRAARSRDPDVFDARAGDSQVGISQQLRQAATVGSEVFGVEQEREALVEVQLVGSGVSLLCTPCVSHCGQPQLVEFLGPR
jgi:hypothetical protein